MRELARVLGVTRATIYRAVERGELRAVRVLSVIRSWCRRPGPDQAGRRRLWEFPGAGFSPPRLSAMLGSVKSTRTKDPRPTLAAYGAPLAGFAPLREMPLEEALVRALVTARRDATVALVLPLVLLKNAGRLRTRYLRKLGRERGVEAELGMMLDLAAALRPAPRLSSAAKGLRPLTGRPTYYPRLLGGKYEKLLADEKTPPAVARWGFRMNATEGDLRGFVEKHLA